MTCIFPSSILMVDLPITIKLSTICNAIAIGIKNQCPILYATRGLNINTMVHVPLRNIPDTLDNVIFVPQHEHFDPNPQKREDRLTPFFSHLGH